MLVSAFSDVLTMNFFWMVKDEGSWLDIGSSISHFCIASLLCVFVAGLEVLSEVFVSGVEVGGEGAGDGDGEWQRQGGGKEERGGDEDGQEEHAAAAASAQVAGLETKESAPVNGDVSNGMTKQ